jgi:hypothetical protein
MRFLGNGICCLSLGLFLGLPGCGNHVPPRVEPEKPDANAAAKAMELYDANHDGFLDAKELEKAPGLKSAFPNVDAKSGGKISEQDIADHIQVWAESRIGRAAVNCQVSHKGKPLEGAKVVFVPEKFLGGNLPSGEGTTIGSGYAQISGSYAADSTVRGLPPGCYRVEITKDGENIPAKYNSETTLGAEVGVGFDARRGLMFDLLY